MAGGLQSGQSLRVGGLVSRFWVWAGYYPQPVTVHNKDDIERGAISEALGFKDC